MNTFEPSNQLCSVTLLGNLVADPEIRYLANPIIAVTDITLATTHKWLDKTTGANKEWTSYHHVKVIGKLVETGLLHAKKGDVLFVQGYIANNKQQPIEIIHATALDHFAKSYTTAINQVFCSGVVSSDIQLVTTEHNKQLATFDISIAHQAFSEHKQIMLPHQITRSVHVWGKQTAYLSNNMTKGTHIIIEGRVSYDNSNMRKQYIEANQVHIVKK